MATPPFSTPAPQRTIVKLQDAISFNGRTFETVLYLQVPDQNLSTRTLASLLRAIEILLCFRAITLDGKASDIWVTRYTDFARQRLGLLDSLIPRYVVESISSPSGTSSYIFDQWVEEVFMGRPPLLVHDIQRGSFDFALHAVNLIAVFGLQDYSLFKDVVQWTTGALKGAMEKVVHTSIARSGESSRLHLMPDLIAAIRDFDHVELIEESDENVKRLRIRLRRLPQK